MLPAQTVDILNARSKPYNYIIQRRFDIYDPIE